jgi:hypothetical protein
MPKNGYFLLYNIITIIIVIMNDTLLTAYNEGTFFFATASRPALRPTQPPSQWVSGTLLPGVKRPEREAEHSRPSSAEIKSE